MNATDMNMPGTKKRTRLIDLNEDYTSSSDDDDDDDSNNIIKQHDYATSSYMTTSSTDHAEDRLSPPPTKFAKLFHHRHDTPTTPLTSFSTTTPTTPTTTTIMTTTKTKILPSDFPTRLLIQIFSYLNYRHLVHDVSLVCQEWNHVSSLDDCWTGIFLSKSHLTDVIARNSAGFHINFKDSKTHNNQTESEQSSTSTTTNDDDETSSTTEEEDDKKMKMQKGNDANDASIDVDIDIEVSDDDDDDDTGEVTAEQVVLEEMISEPRWNPVVLRMTTLPFEAIHTAAAADNDSTEIFCSENRPIDKLCAAADDDESKKEEAPPANDDSVRGGATKKNERSKNKQKVFCPRQQRVNRSSLQVKDLETDWWEYENDHLFEKDDESYERVNKDNKKEEKERQVEKEKQEVTCFGMKGSAPLCLGTIEDQFELIEDSYTADAFKQVVHKSLGVPLEQMTDLVDYPYSLKDRCMEERHKTIVYFATMAPAEKIERLVEKKVNKQDDALMERVRERVLQRQQASLKTKKQQEQTTATTTSSSVATSMIPLDENDDADKDQWKLGINAGIQMLARRAGIKSMDPDAICMAEDLLRDFLKRVISCASERLGEGELPYMSTKYSGLWPYNFDPSRKLKSHEERDEDDAELKVQPEDIYLAVEHEIGKKLYGYAPLRIFEPFSTSNRKIKLLPELEEKEESDTLQTAQDIITSITNEQLWGFDVIEEQDSVRDISLDDDDEEEMDDFIDDSEAASYWSADGFDASKLGDSLQDKLLLASIRAHEEVYGVERAHKEKLYLTNWFGCGPSFFNLTSFNPKSFYHDDVSYVGKTEEEIIAYDKWEDIDYYGNSELLPEEEEEEGEVDGADYHLRRLIRQETLAVLNDFLGHKIEKKIVPSETTAAPQEDASDTESDMLDIELWDESESDEEDTENIRRNSTRAQQAESSVGVSASEEAALTTTNQLPELASNSEVKNETNEEIK